MPLAKRFVVVGFARFTTRVKKRAHGFVSGSVSALLVVGRDSRGKLASSPLAWPARAYVAVLPVPPQCELRDLVRAVEPELREVRVEGQRRVSPALNVHRYEQPKPRAAATLHTRERGFDRVDSLS